MPEESVEVVVARIDQKVTDLEGRLFGTTAHDCGALKQIADRLEAINGVKPTVDALCTRVDAIEDEKLPSRVQRVETIISLALKVLFSSGILGGGLAGVLKLANVF